MSLVIYGPLLPTSTELQSGGGPPPPTTTLGTRKTLMGVGA